MPLFFTAAIGQQRLRGHATLAKRRAKVSFCSVNNPGPILVSSRTAGDQTGLLLMNETLPSLGGARTSISNVWKRQSLTQKDRDSGGDVNVSLYTRMNHYF